MSKRELLNKKDTLHTHTHTHIQIHALVCQNGGEVLGDVYVQYSGEVLVLVVQQEAKDAHLEDKGQSSKDTHI